ncbi:MAG: SH3 domain-containing protein [Sulfuricellaceae bacterium]
MKRTRLLIAALALAASFAAWGESAQTVKATDLKKTPFADAETVASLPENTTVEILKRQGPWMQIKTADKEGWVRMLALRMGDGTAKGGSGGAGLAGLLNIARTGSSGTTVATGVRGLTKEELANAQPNPEEMKKLKQYTVGAKEARTFAAAGGLKAQQVDYLKAPASTANSGNQNSGWGGIQ